MQLHFILLFSSVLLFPSADVLFFIVNYPASPSSMRLSEGEYQVLFYAAFAKTMY